MLCYPKFWRNILFTVALAAVFVFLPLVSIEPSGLMPFYARWAEVLALHVDQFQFYALFNLYPIHDLLTPVMTYVQMGSIALLAVLFVVNRKQFDRFDFRAGSLGILMGWVILFSLSTEKHTYVIALAGYLLWYWVQARKTRLDRTLFWANFVLLVARTGRSGLPDAGHAVPVRHAATEHLLLHVHLAADDLPDVPETDGLSENDRGGSLTLFEFTP